MHKITILILTLTLLYSCSKTAMPQTQDVAPRVVVSTGGKNNVEMKDKQKSEQNFGSGIILISDELGATLYDNDKIIKKWDQNVKIRVEPFDTRFYKIYRDLDNDFQIWLYDSVSGNIHEFGDDKTGDIIEKIKVTDTFIFINTKYSPQKASLNKNPKNFLVTGMFLTYSADFSKLNSWQYLEYDRKISLEGDKEIIINFLKKKGKSNFTIDNFKLKGIYFKNAAYLGGINSGCFQDGNDQICMVPKFFAIIDNGGEVVYFEETNGDYECKDIEKSLSGKVLESVGEKFCPNFLSLLED